MFNGKIHYEWPFSIAMLNYQRVICPAQSHMLHGICTPTFAQKIKITQFCRFLYSSTMEHMGITTTPKIPQVTWGHRPSGGDSEKVQDGRPRFLLKCPVIPKIAIETLY